MCQHASESATLRQYLTSPDSLNPEEQFLRDYVVNARWKRGGGGEGGEEQAGGRDEMLDAEGDEGEGEERFSDREEEFERSHNFRFEEEGAAQVVGHARHAAGSMRR